ncbi:hypothetical protein H0G86_002168 [Trichoderma simmonsii]|uniref:F-box domain-containing protein n=1 Tax=Trichoderma simmonsii TaxID=1491479 RepID=A0A8G0PBW9_9HYPO|nr:hypothetical protein H0G86_002168 [Trichoderma simmonsii]
MANTPATASFPAITRFDSTEKALSLPEILNLIFSFCLDANDLGTLSKAVQVNQLWFECGTEKLWQSRKATPNLVRVPKDRQQIYASKIFTIGFYYSKEINYYEAFKDLEFHRLRELDISSYGQDLRDMEMYCVPSLQKVKFVDLYAKISTLGCLRSCPELKSIHLHVWTGLTPQLVLDVLKHVPSLQEAILINELVDDTSSSVISGDLLLHLAQSKCVTTLELPWSWSASAVEQVTIAKDDMGFASFPVLESLYLVTTAAAIEGAVPLSRNLTSLNLLLEDSDSGALWHIARLTALTTLSLTFRKPIRISAAAITALRALSKLRTLIMKPGRRPLGNFDAPIAIETDFSNDDCEIVASHWPDLRHLSLKLVCANLSTKGLLSLGRHCRSLDFCETSQDINLDELFSDDCNGDALFPQLRTLYFTQAVDGQNGIPSHPSILEAVRLLECRFPMLEDLQIPWDMHRWRTYYHLVLYIWVERKGKRIIRSHLLGNFWLLRIPGIEEYV